MNKLVVEHHADLILSSLSPEVKFQMYRELDQAGVLRSYDIDISGATPEQVCDYLLGIWLRARLGNYLLDLVGRDDYEDLIDERLTRV